MKSESRNWAGNFAYRAVGVRHPQSVAEVQAAVREASVVRALGTRHSFNAIADTAGVHVSLEKLNKIIGIDANAMTVTVEAGVRYGELGQYLHERGFALANLASLPHISVAGACATGTHGSGDRNGNLAASVIGIELVRGDGEVVTLSRETSGDAFDGMVVALGAMGVVTKVTLRIVPTFSIRQWVYDDLAFAAVEGHFEEMFSSAYSVSLFTDWQGGRVSQVWRKCVCDAGDEEVAAKSFLGESFFGATPAPVDRHPIRALSPENCTPQLGVPGPWHERLPHFKMGFTPSSGEELQSEYFVPRQNAVEALRAVVELRDEITPRLQISEVRTIAADSLWMSPCYRQDCVGIHFTWKPDWHGVRKVLPTIEEELLPLGARPHWGKLFTMSAAQIAPSYERLGDFRALANEFDPNGKFRNDFLMKYVFS